MAKDQKPNVPAEFEKAGIVQIEELVKPKTNPVRPQSVTLTAYRDIKGVKEVAAIVKFNVVKKTDPKGPATDVASIGDGYKLLKQKLGIK